jgi:hypothetical protein
MRVTCPVHIIILDSIILTTLARSTSHEALHYEVFSRLTLLTPPWVQMFSSAPCSQTPSVYVLPPMPETKFHAQEKLQFCIFEPLPFQTAVKKTKCSDLNCGKHYSNLNFDLLLLLPNILILPYFLRMY